VALGIELYRTDDYVRAGRIGLASLLVPVFEALLGEPLHNVRFRLNFHPIADATELPGPPQVTNLRSSHGFVTVRIIRDGELIYQHPHAVSEIIGRPLQRILSREVPDEQCWGFGVSGPGLETIVLERPAPRLADSVNVSVQRRRPGAFHVKQVLDPEPPVARLADLGVPEDPGSDAADAPLRVVLATPVHEQLTERMKLSREVEEGGFLLGRLLRDPGGGYLVHVTQAPRAERTGASLLHFTFTGESFLRINKAVADSADGERLVGWYHTHLFPATEGIGLSSIDVELHTGTFLRTWHLAALVNIGASGHRVLRAYNWDGTEIRQAPCLVGRT